MKNVIGNSQVAASASQAPIGTLRAIVAALIVGSPLFTEAEQLRANHNIHACDSPATLNKWMANVLDEVKRRAEATEQAIWRRAEAGKKRAAQKLLCEQAAVVEYVHKPDTNRLVPRPNGDKRSITCRRIWAN